MQAARNETFESVRGRHLKLQHGGGVATRDKVQQGNPAGGE